MTSIRNVHDIEELLAMMRASSTVRDNNLQQGQVYLILKQLQQHKTLTILPQIKEIWDNRFQQCKNPQLISAYYSTFIHIYLNLGQHLIAKSLFYLSYEGLNSLQHLPTIKLLYVLAKYRDCDAICDILELIELEKPELITKATWLYYLSLAFEENHYRLVKLVYDNYLTKDLKTTKEFLQTNVSNYFEDKGLNDSTIYLILQILSTNGDVARSLSLIETFYFQRLMITGQQLSKDLAICVIEAYCFAQNDVESIFLHPNEYKNVHDSSVEKVLDVIGRIMENSTEKLSYKDISQYLSYKFLNYKIYDKNIDEEFTRKQIIYQEQGKQLMKLYNENLEHFPLGNILANLNNLLQFTNTHIKYIQQHNYKCLTLFINCILNHINLYQNFSGMSRLLAGLYDMNSNFVNEWLDQDLMNIIINCLGNSNAKLSSLYIFKFMHRLTKFTISEDNYYSFISSCLRGDFNSQLNYYLYNYHQDYGTINKKSLELLHGLPLSFDLNHLTQTDVNITDKQLENFNRKYDYNLDQRDYSYIRNIFI